MKQKTINTGACELFVCELPNGSIYHSIFKATYGQQILYTRLDSGLSIDLPQGNWRLLGRLPDITEEQAEIIVPNDYHKHIRSDARWYWALLFDFLKDNEVYFENPLGEEPVLDSYRCLGEVNTLKYTSSENDIVDFKYDTYQWREAQSKVWDKERTFLFIKVD